MSRSLSSGRTAREHVNQLTTDTYPTGTCHDSHAAQQLPDDGTARQSVDSRILELLISRLCHELSGPVAAVANGAELLTEDAGITSSSGSAFVRDAVMLVEDSARRATLRLQFYRFAYGFTPSSALVGPMPHEIAAGFFSDSRIDTDYAESIRTSPLDLQKLACNMLAVAAASLLRGGRLVVRDAPLTIEGYGEGATLSAEARHALRLATPIAALTARTVQPYFTGLLAKALGRAMEAAAAPGKIRLTAAPISS